MTSYSAVIRLPGVGALLLATTLARLAGRMFLVLLVLYALNRFGSPAIAGWAGFAALIPGMIASPIAGAALDRLGAGRMIVLDLVASAVWLAVLAALDGLDAMTPPALVALAAAYALTTPLSAAGIRSVLPRLVPAPARDTVNALDTTINAVTDTVGPVIAGPLLGFFGAPAAVGLTAALYLVAAAAALKVLHGDIPGGSRGGLFGQAWSGVRHVVRHPVLRGLALSYGMQTVSWGMLIVIVPVMAARAVGAGAAADSLTGVLWAVAGLAGVAGALLAVDSPSNKRVKTRSQMTVVSAVICTATAPNKGPKMMNSLRP